MENHLMTLDKNPQLLEDAVRATAEALGILPAFVEKDYWITKMLCNLSKNRYAERVVFKGGTSLSKAYRLIARFSEDIDLAILAEGLSGNQIKTIMSSVANDISNGLEEKVIEGLTSKGSRYRKELFTYPSLYNGADSIITQWLTLELNSFANPYPFEMVTIECFIGTFMRERDLSDIIEQYGMLPFQLNVLDKKRTLTEKIVSLVRCSMADDYLPQMQRKIRHFYDLHFLLKDADCSIYLQSNDFKWDFSSLLKEDQQRFSKPDGWQKRTVAESRLIADLSNTWKQLVPTYRSELPGLAYNPIPSEYEINQSIMELISYIPLD
ncbi:MAG: nucleotidyl transferase AbiEii/AbiGii toxin family protein [Paludibacteraceae bacterium]|nr:nucleotidyl transferase AbiEii/AbiGii toxin family protein [Paludibacteraceae bacterium]